VLAHPLARIRDRGGVPSPASTGAPSTSASTSTTPPTRGGGHPDHRHPRRRPSALPVLVPVQGRSCYELAVPGLFFGRTLSVIMEKAKEGGLGLARHPGPDQRGAGEAQMYTRPTRRSPRALRGRGRIGMYIPRERRKSGVTLEFCCPSSTWGSTPDGYRYTQSYEISKKRVRIRRRIGAASD